MKLEISLKQELSLSPQMMQTMKILQMGSQELVEFIHQAVQENPVLDMQESYDKHMEFAEVQQKLLWLKQYDRQNHFYYAQDEESNPLHTISDGNDWEETLFEHISKQIQESKFPAQTKKYMAFLAESLDQNGYLDENIDSLASEIGCTEKEMEDALLCLQTMEPAGIGARNLSECLSLQLARQGRADSLAMQITTCYLDALARSSFSRIAQELGVTTSNVLTACEVIRTLNPKPGMMFRNFGRTPYVIPDIIVNRTQSGFELISNDSRIPTLTFNSYYSELLKDTANQEVKDYLTERFRQAKWVIRSIEQRNSTLMRCAECILDIQTEFLVSGPGHLIPMTLADVAKKLDVHESTVSRTVKDKYLQCASGTYPFAYFFSRSLSADTEDGISADTAKHLLKKLIDDEDKQKPLSDEKLRQLLQQQGIELSRRTVAKYRSELEIPGASGRKRYM